MYNPEPIAPFFDLFYIGEGEVVYDKLFDTYLENKKNGGTRQDFLKKACWIPGIYVPQFYEVTYHEDGTIAAFTPSIPEAPEKIKKQLVMDMTEATYPEKPVVPFIKATQDRVVLEIQRGCIRWYHLLKSHRIALFWKFSEAVSVAVVSARRVWCTVRQESAMWRS